MSAFALWNTDSMGSSQVGTKLEAAYKADSTVATLNGRFRIETKCDDFCRDLKGMSTIMGSLKKQMDSTYGDMKTIIYVTAIGGGLVFLFSLYLILLKNNAQQQ